MKILLYIVLGLVAVLGAAMLFMRGGAADDEGTDGPGASVFLGSAAQFADRAGRLVDSLRGLLGDGGPDGTFDPDADSTRLDVSLTGEK